MKEFPIMVSGGTKGPCPSSIPWDAIAPYEGHALQNHQQTLERLAQRGGLDPVEAFFVMTGRTWRNVHTPVREELEREACAYLDGIVKDKIRIERDALQLQISDLKALLWQARDAITDHDFPAGHRYDVICEEIDKAVGPGDRCRLCGVLASRSTEHVCAKKRDEAIQKKCGNCGHTGTDVTKPVFKFGFDFLCHACDRL